MVGNIRDGKGRYCFDMFGGKKKLKTGRDGTGRDGTGREKKWKLQLPGWDGTGQWVWISSTGRDGFDFMMGRDGK